MTVVMGFDNAAVATGFYCATELDNAAAETSVVSNLDTQPEM